jgi:hypothetical protein
MRAESSKNQFNDYLCSGYFIAKVANRSGPVDFCEICKARLPPGDIVTLSTCLTATIPNHWALEWVTITDENREDRAKRWGLSTSDQKDFIKWTTERFSAGEIGWPNAMRTLKTAKDLLRRFPIERSGSHLLGLGLRKGNAESFIASLAPTREGGLLPDIAKTISQELTLDPSGRLLGYEVLGWEIDGFHSWYCSLSRKDISEQFGIGVGANGLLKTYADAVLVADGAARPHDASPWGSVVWYPWAVVSYPI